MPYRRTDQGLEVFLVHPGGPFWANKDQHAWSIAKGEYSPPEAALEAAIREFREETGFVIESGKLIELGEVTQPGGKNVTAWAVEQDLDPGVIQSNMFSMEWPPRSGKTRQFPEIDKAGWFLLETARIKILKGQIALIDRLEQLLR